MASSWDLQGRCGRTKRREWLVLKAKEALFRCRVVPSSVALETAVVEPRGDRAGAISYMTSEGHASKRDVFFSPKGQSGFESFFKDSKFYPCFPIRRTSAMDVVRRSFFTESFPPNPEFR
jgi:hypothetical protein